MSRPSLNEELWAREAQLEAVRFTWLRQEMDRALIELLLDPRPLRYDPSSGGVCR